MPLLGKTLNFLTYTKCIFEALLVLMRKALLSIFLIGLPFYLAAQTKNINIDWNSGAQAKTFGAAQKATTSENDTSKEALDLLWADGKVSYSTQWTDSNYADGNSVSVSNITYGSLSPEELQKLEKDLIPTKLSYSLGSSMGRDKLYTIFSITPIIKENGSYKKIRSFTINYNYKGQNRGSQQIPISNSVLASGNWYKFKVEKTGIHKMDKSFLKNLGMNVDGINPRNIKVYGNGGKPLPLLNRLNEVFDLPETSIQVVGEEDGSFDNGDYVLFYGTNTEGYDPENDTNLNPYSDASYYYVTADGGAGKRVQPMVEPTGAANKIINQFNDYQFHEKDEISPTKLGRRWFGDRFDIENEQSYEFSFPNIVSGQPMKIVIKTAAASESATSMAISVNSTSLNPLNYPALGEALIRLADFSGEVAASGETTTVDLVYNNAGNPSSVAYLDYVGVEALRQLTGVNGQLAFKYNDAKTLTGIGEYQLSNATQFSQVWDVSNPYFITSKINTGNASSLSFKANLGEIRKYVAVNPNDYFTPVKIGQSHVANQNLKGSIFKDESGNFKDVDYIIITAPFLIQPALRLATYHKNLQGLNVKVVTTDKIYEEFSSGKQDIGAIRNFLRYVYENASTPSKRLKYVGILGDTSVDYKNRIPGNNNIVPTFHTLSINSSVSSFMSDDYFGSIDPDEGTIGGNTLDENGDILRDTDRLDIAMGRMVVDEVGLANAMVDKIINYSSKASYGNWRTNFVLISDDNDKGNEQILEQNLDALGDEISAQKPFINVKKIHSDAYQQQASSGGDRYPEVNEAIIQAMEVGAIIMNYFGHGGEDGLAHEFIYNKETAKSLKNKNNLPCVVTVTCEFTKFDDPQRITAGELTFQNKEGGAISLVTTTRSIGIQLGIDFNEALRQSYLATEQILRIHLLRDFEFQKMEFRILCEGLYFTLAIPPCLWHFRKGISESQN